jgi:hypothetical protein
LADDEVEISISHCGIRHSDVHLVDGEWGDWFPLVPGYEIDLAGGEVVLSAARDLVASPRPAKVTRAKRGTLCPRPGRRSQAKP